MHSSMIFRHQKINSSFERRRQQVSCVCKLVILTGSVSLWLKLVISLLARNRIQSLQSDGAQDNAGVRDKALTLDFISGAGYIVRGSSLCLSVSRISPTFNCPVQPQAACQSSCTARFFSGMQSAHLTLLKKKSWREFSEHARSAAFADDLAGRLK